VNHASDQDAAPWQLSGKAARMLALRDTVFTVWEERVRERIAQARTVQRPILVDTLPVLYDNIAQSISPGYPRHSAIDGTTISAEHGGERARITSYDHTALIEEYQILRWAIFHVLQQDGMVLDYDEAHAINASIDSGIQQSVEAFSLVHSGFRERFAAALTHDMRGPLSATMSALELILLSDDPARIRTTATKALANTRRIAVMIDELLDTMAFHSGESIRLSMSSVDIVALVEEIQAETDASHRTRTRLDMCPANGWWDRPALKRAVENLLANAFKYGAPATPVTVRINEAFGRLLLSVHNEGPPIPPQEHECIFQMYRRAELARRGPDQGWGIGLPYVRAVAESHGGSISLDSSAERGTTFTVDLPLDARQIGDAPTLVQGVA